MIKNVHFNHKVMDIAILMLILLINVINFIFIQMDNVMIYQDKKILLNI